MQTSRTRHWILTVAAGLGLAALAAVGPVAAKPQVGAAAPTFQGMDTSGAKRTLEEFRGQYVVLEWTNHDCPFVKRHYRTNNMQALQKEAGGKGVAWLSIISSAPGRQGHVDAAQADALTRDRDAAPSHVILDPAGDIGRLYDARTTPHMFVIDPEGKLIYMGGIDDNATTWGDDVADAHNFVRAALNEAMAGKAVSKPVSRPYGCSVKYDS